jgi:surface polysaccharide O-acyltransferase-like enzyme
MWFCAALLAFSILYGLARLSGWKEIALLPDRAAIVLFMAVMALSTFLVRVRVSEEASVLNMHPGDFPQYVLMYLAGAYGFRGKWLDEFSDRFCFRTAALTLSISIPLFFALIVLGGGLQGDTAKYSGGFNLVSAGKCLWEALVCAGMALLILAAFRRWFNTQGRLARFLSDNAFGVYLIHPPILIALAIALHPLLWPPIAKAALLTALAAIGSFAASALVLRKSPLRAIV